MYFIVIMAFAFLLSDDLPPRGADVLHPRGMDVLHWIAGDEAAVTHRLGWTLALIAVQLAVIGLTAVITRIRTVRRLRPAAAYHAAATTALSHGQLCLIGMLAAFMVITMLCTPWMKIVRQDWYFGRVPLLADLVILAPFLAALLLMWVVLYRADVRLRLPPPLPAESDPPSRRPTSEGSQALAAARGAGRHPTHSLATYVSDKLRHQILIIAAPMTLVVLAKYLISPYRDAIGRAIPWGGDIALGAVSVCVLLIAPLLLRYVWNTEPLPRGPLRDRFERTCRRIGLRYREILLWHTHGMAINAAVMGFVGPLRYILVSDALLETMDEEEIEAVFGHEAGHVRHFHLQFFMIFVLITMYITGGIGLLLFYTRLVMDSSLLQVVGLATLLASWLFGFGWISRLFERQADLYGVRCVTPDVRVCVAWCPVHGAGAPPSSIDNLPNGPVAPALGPTAGLAESPYTVPPAAIAAGRRDGLCSTAASLFGRTLIRIADLNGIPREAPSWRHGSIESRCRLIEQLATDPAALRNFDKRLYYVKVGLIVAVLIGTGVAGLLWRLGLLA